jgi:hypothetical protein
VVRVTLDAALPTPSHREQTNKHLNFEKQVGEQSKMMSVWNSNKDVRRASGKFDKKRSDRRKEDKTNNI